MVRYHCGTVGMLHETSRAFNPGLLVMFLIQLKIHDIYSFPSPNGWFSLWNYIYIYYFKGSIPHLLGFISTNPLKSTNMDYKLSA